MTSYTVMPVPDNPYEQVFQNDDDTSTTPAQTANSMSDLEPSRKFELTHTDAC